MKRKIFIIILALTILLFSSCFYVSDSGKRPNDFPGTKWVSEDPDIWFEVKERYDMPGKLTVDGESIDIIVAFDFGAGMNIYEGTGKSDCVDDDAIWIFFGRCEFSPDKLIVKPHRQNKHTNDYKDLFLNYQYEEIIFIREDIK